MNALLLLIAVSLVVFLSGVALPFIVSRIENKGRKSFLKPPLLPKSASIEIIIPAYLEAGEIGGAISALRSQIVNWPGVASITVVASDEATADAAREADKVLSVGRQGKPTACNLGVADSEADIILFMDANCRITPDDWGPRLRLHLDQWSLVSANKRESRGNEGAFWRLESAIKRNSSDSTGSLAVVGEFLAFRRDDFEPLPSAVVLDDLWMALSFHKKRLGVTVVSEISTTELAASRRDQWERRVRISAGLLTEAVPRVPWLANTPTGRIYLAHKIYRATLGSIAFWTAVVGISLLLPIVTAPLAILVTALAVGYSSGRLNFRLPLPHLFSLIALQAIPIAGAVRAFRRIARASKGHETHGWTKIAR